MGITKAVDFLKKIKPEDGIVVIYNNDGDGIAACAIFMKFLQRTGRKKPYIISQPMPMDKNIVQRVKTTIPHKIVFLDMAADQQQNIPKQLSGMGEILIIDHHDVAKNSNSSRIVHFNPRIDDKNIYQCASYWTYKLCSKITDMSDTLWVAGVGMVYDYNLEDSKDLVKELREKYPEFGDKKLYATKLGRIADMTSSTNATKELSCDQMVDVLINAADFKDFDDTKNADKMIKSYEIIKHEMEQLEEDAEANGERIGNILFYNIKSEYTISSALSTKLSEKHQKKLVVVYKKIGGRMKVSSRNQAKNIHAANVMKKAAELVGGSGGGHDAAAGATIPAESWDKFREELIKLVNKE